VWFLINEGELYVGTHSSVTCRPMSVCEVVMVIIVSAWKKFAMSHTKNVTFSQGASTHHMHLVWTRHWTKRLGQAHVTTKRKTAQLLYSGGLRFSRSHPRGRVSLLHPLSEFPNALQYGTPIQILHENCYRRLRNNNIQISALVGFDSRLNLFLTVQHINNH